MNYGLRKPQSGRLSEHIRALPPGKILSAEEQRALLARWRADRVLLAELRQAGPPSALIPELERRCDEMLTRLVGCYAKLVYGLAQRLGWQFARAGADSEDLAQIGFLVVLGVIRCYRPDHPSGSELGTTVYLSVVRELRRTVCYLHPQRQRRNGLRARPLHDADPLTQPEPEPDPFEDLLGGEWDWLDEALARVDERARTILVRHCGYDGAEPETLREIAARAGVSKERVRQIKDRALGKLRVELDTMLHRDEGNRSARGVNV